MPGRRREGGRGREGGQRESERARANGSTTRGPFPCEVKGCEERERERQRDRERERKRERKSVESESLGVEIQFLDVGFRAEVFDLGFGV